MSRLCLCILAALLVLFPSEPASASPLRGMWTEVDGPGAARIAACTTPSNRLCATGYERRTNGSIGRAVGLVLVDLREDGPRRWRGTYLDGNRRLPATVRLVSPTMVTMRVCLLVLCQTVSYRRTSE